MVKPDFRQMTHAAYILKYGDCGMNFDHIHRGVAHYTRRYPTFTLRGKVQLETFTTTYASMGACSEVFTALSVESFNGKILTEVIL